jgi:hypothetical protein
MKTPSISKIDKDTYEIKTETVETVSLSQLEAELENLEKLEKEANDFNAWVDTLPADKQTFIQKQYIVVPQELRDKVEQLKKVK